MDRGGSSSSSATDAEKNGWDHADPFQEDQQGQQDTPGQPNRVAFSHPSPEARTSNEADSHSRNDSNSSGEQKLERVHTYEKIKHAAEDVAPGLVEKIRTAKELLHLHSVKATGPTNFFNPTNIRMKVHFRHNSDENTDFGMRDSKDMDLLWRSRDNRKGRNSIAVPEMPTEETPFLPMRYTPRLSTKFADIRKNLWKMCTTFAYWDMAFWSGWSYTIGSALFVTNGVLAWGPKAFGEDFESAQTEGYGPSLTFFIGALFYQIGAVTAYLEAVNDGSFHGAAMRKLLEGHDDDNKKLLDDKIHHFFSHMNPAHRHREEVYQDPRVNLNPEAGWNTKEARNLRPGSIYPRDKHPAPRRGAVDMGGEESEGSGYMVWRWWPTWKALRTHHVYEIGYTACAIQLFGVTLYGVTAIVILPGILSSLNWWQTLGAYWCPQIVAALCFLTASIMFQLETQENWWKPEPKVLGWWIGIWSVVGSVGFELCACFGTAAAVREWHWAEYQSDLSSMWGSAAYLTGSFLQWYEALNKNPLEELLNEPGEMKSHQIHPI
ncbi:hypothetical protein CLAFUW4_11157 [Fulvia fulva]|uniref:Integral membrane protein n=1 Tax=Passalora fulva TaxID=5499 RepID=A0A9Q8URN2_PASFU|nr:uncharacterized protein CLAFUR5_10200 [Fulvia fulva]KAK4619460.1 hypothetical protein CLAFUR4_11162 [Fulvia fulva]KAK4620516.1 hypothetical protein CLAFUR0_11167 [Fulvia fulva]UJO19901.1 hypothetical protein CLAFUR5_10200 [Fulvia fulva]WPV16902.1 hypothetical protein CLAFUW4_11157 [Fulvia fulva]WPV32328.1 hypothetical protein CLAFUW7_11153 [Fulvia fulva]